MPTVIREFARAEAGEVGALAAGVFSSGELLTAVRNGSDDLELIAWHPDAASLSFTRGADSGTQAGEIGEVALAMMGHRCITAVQNANGYLLLIPWAIETDGTISRLEVADHQAGKATYLSIAALSEGRAVTPVRNGAGNLLIIPWSLDDATGQISRLDHGLAQGGAVASGSIWLAGTSVPLEGPLIACATLDDSNFVTAKVNGAGGVELAGWAIEPDFRPVAWQQKDVYPLADYLAMAPLGDRGEKREFVLAYRTITPQLFGNSIVLKKEVVVSIWRASANDGTLTQVAQAAAGDMTSIGVAGGANAVNGRPLILLSGRDDAANSLINTAFELIEVADGAAALVLTGKVHDDAFDDISVTAPVSLAPGQFAMTAGYGAGLGLVGYNLYDISATLVRPLAQNTAGECSALRIGRLDPDQAIVALRNGSGNLEIIGWRLAAADFAVARAADTSGHPIEAREVALAVLDRGVVTAIRSGSDRLRLDSWAVSPDLSTITWLHETGTAAGEADLVTATALNPDLIVTAVRNGSGKLLLIVWRLEADGTLSRLNHEDNQAGEFDEIALAGLDSSHVVTAVRNGSGNLQVIGWTIDTNGTVTRWAVDGSAGEISAIAIAVLDGDGPTRDIVTAVRDGSNNLLLIAWRASLDDRTIYRLADSHDQGRDDNAASDLSLCVVRSAPGGLQTIVSAQRRESGNLKLIAWQLQDDPSGVPLLVQTGDMTNRADTDVRITDSCPIEDGRFAVAARLASKESNGLWLSTFQLRDAQIARAPASILGLLDNPSPPDFPDETWALSNGHTDPSDTRFEWQQVQSARGEYDDGTLMGATGWVVAPEESGADVPFSHPFGFDWECSIALDAPSRGLLSPANASAEEEEGSPNRNGIALADQLGLTTPEGLLGLEWDKGLLPASYRGQVNHGDRIAVLGRWILDNGHNVDGFYRTEIHPPLLIATGSVQQPADGSEPRTRVLFMSRAFLAGQTYTNILDTRNQDGVDDDGPLLHPLLESHAFKQLTSVLSFGSTMIEIYPKIKEKPFRGSHVATFVVSPPQPRPDPFAQLVVSYRFNVRPPCRVTITQNPDSENRDSVLVIVELRETGDDGTQYQAPNLTGRREETYSTDDLDLLSPGSGSSIALGEHLIELLVGGIYAWLILRRGLKADVFASLPEFNILDPNGGVSGIPVQQIVPGEGVVSGFDRDCPVTGWIEAFWAEPVVL
jgi:hypothetical protein